MKKRKAMDGERNKEANYIERSVLRYVLGRVLSLGVTETRWCPQSTEDLGSPQHVAGGGDPHQNPLVGKRLVFLCGARHLS